MTTTTMSKTAIWLVAALLAAPAWAAQSQRGEDASTRNATLRRYLNPGFHQSYRQRLENHSKHPARTGSGGGGDASSSTASNYGGGSSISVNPRPGGISLDAQLFNLHGFQEEIEL
jgi:hypothetical protein